MNSPDIMKTKDPTHEVSPRQAMTSASDTVTCETFPNGQVWLVRIEQAGEQVCLNAAEAMAVADFIRTNVRKRWAP